MSVPAATWWSRLSPQTREWLTDHNGEHIPAPLVSEMEHAGSELATSAWWAGAVGAGGVEPSDEAVDWIETVANGEDPADLRIER